MKIAPPCITQLDTRGPSARFCLLRLFFGDPVSLSYEMSDPSPLSSPAPAPTPPSAVDLREGGGLFCAALAKSAAFSWTTPRGARRLLRLKKLAPSESLSFSDSSGTVTAENVVGSRRVLGARAVEVLAEA